VNNVSEADVGCIVGAVVHMVPDNHGLVKEQLSMLEGVDIHVEDERFRLVITIEAATSRAAVSLTESIQDINGVMHVAMVYQHCEGLNKTQEEGWTWR